MSRAYAAGLVLVVTDRAQVPEGRTVIDVVAAALDGGAHGVVVRERQLPPQGRAALVAAVSRLCTEHDALLLVASPFPPLPAGRCGRPRSAPIDPIDPAGARRVAVHLRRDEAVPADLDRATTLVGRSCHDLAELRRACTDGLDHVTLSPVAASASKPGHGPAIGAGGLRDLMATVRAECTEPPVVLALGGVDASNAGSWLEAGADGVAVMGAVMGAADPAATTRAIVESVAEAREARR